MIPERYRQVVPPYRFELDMDVRHFGVMEQVMDDREQSIDDLGNQFIIQRATWALTVWEWIYFRKDQTGTTDQRRELIRRKKWAQRLFTLPVLRLLGNQRGKLLNIVEDFENKQISFEYSALQPLDLPGLLADFEYIRPVHINRVLGVTTIPQLNIVNAAAVRGNSIDFPICGFEVPMG